MDSYWKLWEKLPCGNDRNNIRVGPTDECLSPNRVASFMNAGEEDSRIIEHLKNCKTCQEGITRFKQSNTF